MRNLLVIAAILSALPLAAAAQPPKPIPLLTGAQADYIEYCSGCHGIQATSAPADIPVLRDRVGYFMCTQEGREYLIRLPNVAFAPITDSQQLANLMNFIVFGLGGKSTPRTAKPFQPSEIARLRKQPMSAQSLIDTRDRVVGHLIADKACGAPDSLRFAFPQEAGGAPISRPY